MTYQLITGDSAEVLAGMDAGSVDLILTSPPYDNLRDYKGFAFDFPRIAAELTRVLKVGGVIMWNVADATINGGETLSSFRQAIYFVDECGLRMHDTMIWKKTTPPHPPNIIKGRYGHIFEYCFILSKGRPKTIHLIVDKANKTAGAIYAHSRVRNKDGNTIRNDAPEAKETPDYGIRNNVWVMAGDYSTKIHPATMPLALAADHIRSWSREGDLVLDPFSGSGTTGVAARQLARRYIGIDISAEYNRIAEKRIEAEAGNLL